MERQGSIVIVGGGLAGAKAAEAARARGFDGRITLVGDEPRLPYERPPLSKAVLRGEADAESARVHDADFYVANDIDLVTGQAVVALDVAGRSVTLATGSTVGFDRVILATGAEPRRLAVPGADLDGVHYLRDVEDAAKLREAVTDAARVAVVGAGWIGTEVAASARQMGTEVVLIDPADVPLQRVLGDHIGAAFARLHGDNGVALRLGVGVASLRGGERVEEVVLSDGRRERADVVVAGIGVTPRVDLARQAGLPIEDGVVVDDHLRAGAPGVFAAGDIASAYHPHYRRHLRVEHWANALNQGMTAGANAAGGEDVYDRLPYFFSDQYDLGLEYVGHAGGRDDVVVRGDLDDRKFIAFWHRDGVVTAAMNVNVWDVVEDLKAIVGANRSIGIDRLADPAVPLADLGQG